MHTAHELKERLYIFVLEKLLAHPECEKLSDVERIPLPGREKSLTTGVRGHIPREKLTMKLSIISMEVEDEGEWVGAKAAQRE